MIKVFYGEEPYLINHNKKKLLKDIDEFAISTYEEWTDDLAATLNMSFYDKTAIIVKGALPAKSEIFKKLIKEENDNYIIIFLPGASVDRRTSLVKEMDKADMLTNCKKFESNRVHNFIRKILNEKHILDEDISFLINRMGYYEDQAVNLYTLEIAAKKLSFVEETEITRDVICREVTENVTAKAYVLFDYLINNQMKCYFDLYEELSRTENTIGLLSLLLYSARVNYKASLGYTAKEIGVLPVSINYRKIHVGKLRELLRIFQDVIADIKGGLLSDKDAFTKASFIAFDILQTK